ncbi:hypothetical protein KP509_16G017400 [Ceratopteris richardii]|uniref:Uncharacterized protein n=1 Tax=Ceratopteris richardii TaxID=49495 RepID=A0A8T2SWZ2_CERRI|nr:hypothetical protein KP509_16G017400 [Ceratopteris richardii]
MLTGMQISRHGFKSFGSEENVKFAKCRMLLLFTFLFYCLSFSKSLLVIWSFHARADGMRSGNLLLGRLDELHNRFPPHALRLDARTQRTTDAHRLRLNNIIFIAGALSSLLQEAVVLLSKHMVSYSICLDRISCFLDNPSVSFVRICFYLLFFSWKYFNPLLRLESFQCSFFFFTAILW